jgi:protein-S-isoprenylcysteine O-methyltransferase Ste14
VSPSDDRATAGASVAANADVRTANLLVAGQFVLVGLVVLLPRRADWPVPGALVVTAVLAAVVGLAVVVLAATTLGRGLTPTPLPNAHAQLRTGGLYRFVRHPIYSGLLLIMVALAATSGSWFRLLALGLLLILLTAKARWEEARLAARFPGYARYAATTPRFVPHPRRRPADRRTP